MLPPIPIIDREEEGVTYSVSDQALEFVRDEDTQTMFVYAMSTLTINGLVASDNGTKVECHAYYLNNTDTFDLIASNITEAPVTVLSKLPVAIAT